MAPGGSESPLSVGMAWASRITGFGVEVALLAVAGNFLDRRLGTLPWGTLVGTAAGFALGLTHLLAIVNRPNRP